MAINFSQGSIQAYLETNNYRIQFPQNTRFKDWPAFHAYKNDGHMTVNWGTSYPDIIFNGTHVNNGNDYSTTTGRYTAPIAGYYWFYFWSMDHGGATQYVNDYVRLRRNNSTVDVNSLRIYTSSDGAYRSYAAGGYVQYMNAGDFVSVNNVNRSCYGTSAVYLHFSGCLITI